MVHRRRGVLRGGLAEGARANQEGEQDDEFRRHGSRKGVGLSDPGLVSSDAFAPFHRFDPWRPRGFVVAPSAAMAMMMDHESSAVDDAAGWPPAASLENAFQSGTLLLGHKGRCFHSAFAAHDDGLLATASEDGTVRVWDTSSRRCCHVLRHCRDDEALRVAWAPPSVLGVGAAPLLATTGADGTLQIWRSVSAARDAQAQRVHVAEHDQNDAGEAAQLYGCLWAPRGACGMSSPMLITASDDLVHFWDASRMQRVGAWRSEPPSSPPSRAASVVIIAPPSRARAPQLHRAVRAADGRRRAQSRRPELCVRH